MTPGIGSMPKKVAGARWTGSKKTFGEEDNADEADDEKDEELKSEKKKKSKSGNSSSKGQTNGLPKDVAVKLKKLVLQLLKDSDGKLAVGRLQKRVVAKWSDAMKKTKGLTASKDAIDVMLKSKLEQWKQTKVSGKKVILVNDT